MEDFLLFLLAVIVVIVPFPGDRQRGKLKEMQGQPRAPDELLLETMREVDAFLPGTPRIAPPETRWERNERMRYPMASPSVRRAWDLSR